MAEERDVVILVIEDSPTSTELVKFWIEDGLPMPCRVETATSLADGLKVLEGNQVDVIILDLNLPDSLGLDTFLKLQQYSGEVAIVVMTSVDDEQVALSAVRQGAQDYIVKESFEKNPLARPVSFAIERIARRRAERLLQQTEEQLIVARAIQQQLFPADDHSIPGIDIAGHCEPAETAGGDYYDFFPMLGDHVGVLVGDVSGHGIGAAMIMVQVRAMLRALVTSYRDVGHILTETNRLLQTDLEGGKFVTMLFACIHPQARTLRIAAAGHNGYLLDAAGNVKQLLESAETPLAVVEDCNYATSSLIQLDSGDLLIKVTDGITETVNGAEDEFGDQGVLDVVRRHQDRPASEIIKEVFAAVKQFANGKPAKDDRTVVVCKVE